MKNYFTEKKPHLSILITTSMILTFLAILSPGLLLLNHTYKNRMFQEKLDVLNQINSTWASRVNIRFKSAMESLQRFSIIVSDISAQPDPEAIKMFERITKKNKDGTWRSIRETFDSEYEAGIWLQRNHTLTDDAKHFFAEAKIATQVFGQGALNVFYNTWILPKHGGIVIFWPEFPEWPYTADADLDHTETDWVRLTKPAVNPEGLPMWTHVMMDPSVGVWMISVVAPYTRAGRWAGAVGHDLPVNNIVEWIEETVVYPETHYADRFLYNTFWLPPFIVFASWGLF